MPHPGKKLLTYIMLIPLIFTGIMLSGCTLQPSKETAKPDQPIKSPPTEKPALLSRATEKADKQKKELSVKELVQEAAASKSPSREIYLIKASHKALNQNKPKTANAIYTTIEPNNITAARDLDYYYHLIGLQLAIAQSAQELMSEKLRALDTISTSRKVLLSTKSYILDTEVRAQTMAAQGNALNAAQLLVDRSSALNPSKYNVKDIHNKIWRYLGAYRLKNATRAGNTSKQSNNDTLEINLSQSTSHEWQAWLELSDLFVNTVNRNVSQSQSLLNSWSKTWSFTRVAQKPPQQVANFIIEDFKPISQVAIILPSTGQYEYAGQAVIDGIMAARGVQENQNLPTPDMKFYDSAKGQPIKEIYSQALAEGAQFIIGPLEKDKVAELGSLSKLDAPVLALNYRTQGSAANLSGTDNFYEFGLRAEDEATAVAQYAFEKGYKRALILRPDTDWGNRISKAFKTQWQGLDGKVLKEAAFTQPRQYSTEIAELLGIRESKARHKAMERATGKKIKFTPRIRDDIDFIFLLATPKEARQLKPTINFHYGENIPVLATSHVFSGKSNPTFDNDLENIRFVDMPWIIGKTKALKEQYGESQPTSETQFQRLYALGIDSFQILQDFPVIRHMSETQIKGATGNLTLTEGQITRDLVWGQFKNGNVVTLDD